MSITSNRRQFVKNLALLTGASVLPSLTWAAPKTSKMKLGLVTYQWGKDWDVPALIENCTKAKIYGVELRTMHAHGVEPSISPARRKEVKKMFADSKVKIVGLGTNQQYDFIEPEKLKQSIEQTKEFIKLSADVGGTGVKVKPNAFHKEVPHEKTIEQIGKALNEVGKFGADFGQKIRLEVHGEETQELPNIKAIMDVANNPNVYTCWNCNDQDLIGEGLVKNFNMVKARQGDTVHVRELNVGSYPYQELMNLFMEMDYSGWILLECRTEPNDKLKALIEQHEVFDKMTKKS
jgi:sugar phosphate isomerase/epimerase